MPVALTLIELSSWQSQPMVDTSPSGGNDEPMRSGRSQIIESTDRRWVKAAAGQDRALLELRSAERVLATRPISVTETGDLELRCPWCTGMHRVPPDLLGQTLTAPCRRGELHVVHEITDGRR
jgi:hypothetical protein